MEKRAIIIGAGPAGLTAAYELLKRTDIKPVILEKSGDIGGISKTVNYKGNRIDIGGHRFFSKSDRVMNWWMNIMPVEENQKEAFNITYQNKSRKVDLSNETNNGAPISDPDKVMLVRPRLSRIYFLRKFFTYPIQLSIDTLRKLGLSTTIAIMFSYLKAQLSPRRPEKNLEDFMINRFGQVLYKLFFKDYTQKVWGVPCQDIPAEWGAQRIKGVSIAKAIQHAIQSATKRNAKGDILQKATETSLIEQFLYPKYGPGQLWEEVARQVESMGGTILMHHDVEHVYTNTEQSRITAIAAADNTSGKTVYLEGDYFFSTMPVKELIAAVDTGVPENVKEIAAGLQYRDFITVGILLRQLSSQDKATGEWHPLELKDTWIYIQEKEVTVGRLQIFNNWSPYMVNIPGTVWVGMEFFCNSTDAFWNKHDQDIKALAIRELEKIGLASPANVMDATVIRMEKTYPAYFGAYKNFDQVRNYTDQLKNLFLIGRNGMHKYNNSDHSMLTAMVAVDNIAAGVTDKDNIWSINTEQDYHEVARADGSDKKGKEDVKLPQSESAGIQWFFGNKGLMIGTASLIILQFLLFKLLYPFANYMPDSYYYLEAAWNNSNINIWPIGYSKFLRIVNTFFRSDTALVFTQFLFFELTIVFYVVSMGYFLKMSRKLVLILIAALMLNPMIIFISNYVSADALFTSLSLLWFTQLLWLIYRPSASFIVLHGILLLALLSVRYNALYYPIISVLVLLAARVSWSYRLACFCWIAVLLGMFIKENKSEYRSFAGSAQFAPFSGWQLASNALFMYRRLDETVRVPVTDRFKGIDDEVRHHMDSLRALRHRPDSVLGTYYLWSGPLKSHLMRDPVASQDFFKAWSSVAPMYAAYGRYLIAKYPLQYVKYFLGANFLNYFYPSPEFMSVYNLKRDSVGTLAQTWFGYNNSKVKAYSMEPKLLKYSSALKMVVEFLFILSCIGFTYYGFMKQLSKNQKVVIAIVGIVWGLNLLFSVMASPIVLRYQLFLMIIQVPIAVFFVKRITDEDQTEKTSI
ncbi:Protoporphyrinogen oxidase [Chitinophaga rupis]|uniref:Protoporphyrinogen oxidase n=1 Tax=Chitinophaga rupis TaxID=573321 RepID=A0A1H8IV51_9BACT|nr:NAD(P)/FAD-dependent oxidoreductase [Chitinophaga rupis]SEN72025.1 Protoporphyrinogen oxidase [Chitinophaga rupis]